MKFLTVEEVRNEQLKMLDYISSICKEYNINYYLAYGTLLGSIRHNGFIPWDDDIDLWIIRNDYEKLKSIVNKDSKYRIEDVSNNDNYRHFFGKLINKEIMIEEPNSIVSAGGLYIDLFQLESFGNDENTMFERIKKLNKLKKRFYYYSRPIKSFKQKSKIKSLIFYCIALIIKTIMIFLSPKKSLKKYNDLCLSLSNDDSHYFGLLLNPFKNQYLVFEKDDLISIEHVFENNMYSIPKSYDKILKKVYGNYMQLPPEEQRRIHGFKAWYINK